MDDDISNPRTIEDLDHYLDSQNLVVYASGKRHFIIVKKHRFDYRVRDSQGGETTPHTDLGALMVQLLMRMSQDD